MTDHPPDEQLDHDIRSFLAWRAEDIADAPTATEVAMGIKARAGSRPGVPRISAQLASLLIVGLLTVALMGAAVGGASLLRDNRALLVVDPTPTVAPTASAQAPTTPAITGGLPAQQRAIIASHAAALNSRHGEAFVEVFAANGAFNPRGTFSASSAMFSNILPTADRSLLEPFMAINGAWGVRAEVVTCDQLTKADYARRYTVHSNNVEVFAHCAVRSRWPRLSLEIGEWWTYEFRGSEILWWGQAVRDATPADRSLPLDLNGLLEWETWLEATDSDAAARLLNPRVYPVSVPCGYGVAWNESHTVTAAPLPPCELSSDDVDVERITSDCCYGRAEDDWIIAGKRFWPSALIPYDPALADEIEASINDFLSQRGDE